jgi:MoaA/NifB/PqqE/SkfB family radical SAM enzyme
VKIELTGRCNYRCGFCALATRAAQPATDMDFGVFQRITREMRAAGVEEIGLFYIGESFLSPDLLVRAIDYLKRDLQMPYVFLTSNASAATPAHVERCMAAGLDSLKWSVNAGDEAQFAAVMNVSPRLFARALDHIKQAWKIRARQGYTTGLYASSIRYDGEQHERMEALLTEHVRPYVDEHYWLPLYSMGSLATDRERDLGYRPLVGNVGRADAQVPAMPCWSVFTEGHVLSDGRLSACCFDASGHWVVGDLTTQSFMEAWHSEPFRVIRQAQLDGDVRGTACEDCLVGA